MKHYLSALSLVVITSLSGCGGGGSPPTLPAAQNPPSIHTNDVAIPPGAVHRFPIPPVLVSEMTLGPDGNLWYTAQTDTQNLPTDVIGRVTPTGAVTVFHTPTAQSEPSGIVAGPDGNLWAVEANAAKLVRITTSGVMTEFQMPFPSAVPPFVSSLTVGPDKNIWYWDARSDEEDKLDLATDKITLGPGVVIASQGISSSVLFTGPDGNLWVDEDDDTANTGHIAVLNGTSGQVIREFALSPPPTNQITSGPDGNVWYTDRGNPLPRINRLTTSGTATPFALPPGNRETPIYLTPANDGNIYFSLGTSLLGRITTAGSITIFDLPFTCPNADSLALAKGAGQTLWMFDGSQSFTIDLIDLTQLGASSAHRRI